MTPEPHFQARRHRQRVNVVKRSLRDLRGELALLNQRIGGRAAIKPADLDCLDLIGRRGPLTPSALAQYTGVHSATLTGILDRLERGGWIARERDPGGSDRRTVQVRALRGRNAELVGLYADMNTRMDRICADYSPEQLELIADFLHRTTEAGRAATVEIERQDATD